MPSLTRGPLSSSVYWRRRLVLLTVAIILVVAIAKLLGHGSDASSPAAGPDAQGVAAVTSDDSTPTPSYPSSSLPPAGPRVRHTPTPSMPTSSAPAEPTGTCQSSDVLVSPHVDEAVVGQPVTITLAVSTVSEPACYWHLSPSTAQVRISRGGATVWSTADCGVAVPREQVVARQDEPTSVTMSWAGHRTDEACSSHDPWVKTPGRYWVSAAALGGQPSTASFVLAKTATETTSPSTTATPGETPSTTATPGTTEGATPSTTATPTGGAKRSAGTLPPNSAD